MQRISGFILPGLFVLVWLLILCGVTPPGVMATDTAYAYCIRWLLYFCGWAFASSAVMHSIFSKKMAESIGWRSNGFQYEIAAVSLGLCVGSFYAVYHEVEAWYAVSLPIISFLFFAGINHVIEIIRIKNYAPNNTFIIIWDFGIAISLGVLLLLV
jgi:hypothetical protein